MLVSGVIGLNKTWEEHVDVPILGVIFVLFGIVFEFGAATDVANVLPYYVDVDVGLLFHS